MSDRRRDKERPRERGGYDQPRERDHDGHRDADRHRDSHRDRDRDRDRDGKILVACFWKCGLEIYMMFLHIIGHAPHGMELFW
ncbi:hypothetical protein ZWY2020_051288 [Hordeum vulgare]|nr:hypothetical protein ZWY2020_051288 [Hordeum vulgare]